MNDIYESLERLEKDIEVNLKKISKLTNIWHKKQTDPEAFFRAWHLIRETAEMVEELEQAYNRFKGREIIN